MAIFELEEKLFSEWRNVRSDFVADGVADEKNYLESSRKILFILKEVNSPGEGGWDLRNLLREPDRPQTWNNITRWIEGIRRLPEEILWEDLVDIDQTRRYRSLISIAAVNLKKSPGGHTSDPAEVAKIAEEDKLFLNRQISLYDADLIICCGTSDPFHWLVSVCEEPDWKMTKRGTWFHEYKPGKFVVSYLHPEARCAPQLLYYGLIDAIREITILKDTLTNN